MKDSGKKEKHPKSMSIIENGMTAFRASIVDSSDDAIIGKTLEGHDHELEPRRRAHVWLYGGGDHRQARLHPHCPRTGPKEMDEILGQDPRRASASSTTRRSAGARTARLFDVSLTVSPIHDIGGPADRRFVHRPRHHRAQAHRRAVAGDIPVRPQPDRGQPRPAGHHQPGREDHRRQRGDGEGHRRPARAADRDRLLRLLHRAGEGAGRIPAGLRRRASSPTTR